MTKIIFLGTGGGRFATVYQVRRTGGIYLEDGARIHLDPGPGACLAMRNMRLDPSRTDAVIISHCHPDHYGDAEIILEGMTSCSFTRRGLLAGSRSAILGTSDFGPAISRYHRSIIPEIKAMLPGDELEIKGVRLKATRTAHTDPDGIGFRFLTTKGVVCYVGDTELQNEILDEHKGARVLIMNVTTPLHSRVRYHLCTEDAAEMARVIKPELAVITHFGSKMVHDGPEYQRRYVEEESGVRTIAAEDFMTLHLNQRISLRRMKAVKASG
ncbi:MAG: MBL fold metallo-hydrolase [Methanomassiliicoccales archaeon]